MLRKAVNLVTLAHYVLMNKNTPVLSFDYDLGDHKAVRIREVFAPEAAPFGFVDRRGDISKAELNYWWRHRAIPASRAHVKRLLENLQLESTLVLAEKSFGLSLSDRYWLNDEDDPASWDAVNFFDNDFSDDLGFLTLGQDLAGSSPDAPDYRTVSLSSPNSTLGGDLLKKWKIVNGEVVKAFTHEDATRAEFNQLNENYRVSASKATFVRAHLDYEDGRRVYSACPNLLGPDEELVAAWDVIRNVKQPNNLSDLRFYVKHLEDLGLDADATMTSLAKMFAGDFVLANRDRHYRNFGIIRNVETLEVTGIAPVFDSGSCLWSDAEFLEVPGDFLYMAKPFKMNGMKPVDQLRLFDGYFDWFDPVMLDGYPEEVGAILSQNPNIPERRVATIVDAVRSKVDLLTRIAR